MPIPDENALPRLLGHLYTEVFQRKTANPNKPLNQSIHAPYEQVMSDSVKARLDDRSITNNSIWGPGGISDELDTGGVENQSMRWSFTGQWA